MLIDNLRLAKRFGVIPLIKLKFGSRGQSVIVPALGKKVSLRSRTSDLDVLLSTSLSEFRMLRHLLPRDFKGLIVDAGGNIGLTSIILRNQYPLARILLVEPSSENLAIAKVNTEGLNIEYLNAALTGVQRQSATLKKRKSGEVGFTIVDCPADEPHAEEFENVSCVSLAELCGEREELGILKLDIEGAELEIFAQNCASANMFKVIFVELHERIAPGCEAAFFACSENRVVIQGEKEKYLSIAKSSVAQIP